MQRGNSTEHETRRRRGVISWEVPDGAAPPYRWVEIEDPRDGCEMHGIERRAGGSRRGIVESCAFVAYVDERTWRAAEAAGWPEDASGVGALLRLRDLAPRAGDPAWTLMVVGAFLGAPVGRA